MTETKTTSDSSGNRVTGWPAGSVFLVSFRSQKTTAKVLILPLVLLTPGL